MKNGTHRTSMSMVSPTADDLKAIHSIEAILGIKNLHHHHHPSHLYPPHLFPLEKFDHKKRHVHESSSSKSKYR